MKTINIHDYQSIPLENWSYLVGYKLTEGVDYTISQYVIHVFNWIKINCGYALNISVHAYVSDDVYNYLEHLNSNVNTKSFLCYYFEEKISKDTPQEEYSQIQYVYKTTVLLSHVSCLFLRDFRNISKEEIKRLIHQDKRFNDVNDTQKECIENDIFVDLFIPKIITEPSIKLVLNCLKMLVLNQQSNVLIYLDLLEKHSFPFKMATINKSKLHMLYFAMCWRYPIDVVQRLVDYGCTFVTGNVGELTYCNAFDRLEKMCFKKCKSPEDVGKALCYVESIHERFNNSKLTLIPWLALHRLNESEQIDDLKKDEIIRFFNFYGSYLGRTDINDVDRLDTIIQVLGTIKEKGYDMSRLTGDHKSDNMIYQAVLNMYPMELVKAILEHLPINVKINFDMLFFEIKCLTGVSQDVINGYLQAVRHLMDSVIKKTHISENDTDG
jgi:hypothetical protein